LVGKNQAFSGPAPEKILYIGGDQGYWSSIQDILNKDYRFFTWEFNQIEVEGQLPQTFYVDILKYKPRIIYIDFSVRTREMLILADLLSRDNAFKKIPIVGLLEDKEEVKPLLGAGVDFLYVKDGETFDPVFAPISMVYPKKVTKPQFATAKLTQEVDLIDDLQIGFVTPAYLHAEGNFLLKEGDDISFETEIPKKNIPSKRYKVKAIRTNDLFYDYKYAYDLSFMFVDPPQIGESENSDILAHGDDKLKAQFVADAEKRKKVLIDEYKQTIIRVKKKHKQWVVNNLTSGAEKKTKILLVDKYMRVLLDTDKGPIDKQHFAFRCQSVLSLNYQELESIKPGIIAIQMVSQFSPDQEYLLDKAIEVQQKMKGGGEAEGFLENSDEDKAVLQILEDISAAEKESLKLLHGLITKIRSMQNYSPIVLLFRCYFQTSEALQQSYLYPMIMVQKESMSLDVIKKMAVAVEKKQTEKYEMILKQKVGQLKKKDPQKYRNLSTFDLKEKQFFISKNVPLGHGSYKLKIIITTMNESVITFTCKQVLPLKSYRMDYPMEFSIHLVPMDNGKPFEEIKGLYHYKSLIHSIDEENKKALRRHINDVFFEPLKEQREKDDQEYWERHQELLKVRGDDEPEGE
jgi:hypothetical protein